MIEDDPEERRLWAYTAFVVTEEGRHKRREWYEEDEDQDPDDYVTEPDNLSSLVKDIYYKGRLIWTRTSQQQPWTRHSPQPSRSEDPLW